MVYIFLADGFETVEALAVVDILRRAQIPCSMVSIMDSREVVSAQNIQVTADEMFDDLSFDDASAVFLPGGMPGALNLDAHEGVRETVFSAAKSGKLVTAICAAPLVLGHLGLLKGRTCTCYPGFESELTGGNYTAGLLEKDGNIITACGPAAAMELGYEIVDSLKGEGASAALREGMRYNKLLGN